MKPIEKVLSSLLACSEYGVSQYTDTECSKDPSRAEFGFEGITLVARHQNLYIWKRKQHWETVFFFFIPIWWKWIDDEIALVGEIHRTEDGSTCKIYDHAFGSEIYELNEKQSILLEWCSSTPEFKWTWNETRNQWFPLQCFNYH